MVRLKSFSFWNMLAAIAATLLGVTAFSVVSVLIALIAVTLIVLLWLISWVEGQRSAIAYGVAK